jgi:hypothetical protein
MAKISEHQKKQLKDLRSYKEGAYADASIYTILLDLVEGNGFDNVFQVLHQLSSDLGEREELEKMFDVAKKWTWS